MDPLDKEMYIYCSSSAQMSEAYIDKQGYIYIVQKGDITPDIAIWIHAVTVNALQSVI